MTARTAVLSEGQLALLAEHGEERRAEVGDVLVRVGDRRYRRSAGASAVAGVSTRGSKQDRADAYKALSPAPRRARNRGHADRRPRQESGRPGHRRARARPRSRFAGATPARPAGTSSTYRAAAS